MPENAYVHIPFCRSKCNYCSFFSVTDFGLKDDYLAALKKEIKFCYKNEPLKTLYFGGGTPSLLEARELEELIGSFNLLPDAEVTVEMNPDFLSPLRGRAGVGGVNRLSIGVQTFDDNILSLIGRRHSAAQAVNAVCQAQAAGFDNISVDFIYGLPGQTPAGFARDLQQAIELGVQHISLYGLKIDEGCYFHACPPPQLLPDEDEQADMYLMAIEILETGGFEHYEFSNFVRAGFESRHNLNYWNNNEYYGFGAAAHGCLHSSHSELVSESLCQRGPETSSGRCIRYCNTCDIQEYIADPLQHEMQTIITPQMQLEEEIFLGLRKMSGIDVEAINKKFNIDFRGKYSDVLDKYAQYFVETPCGYALTKNGVLNSNAILSEFIE